MEHSLKKTILVLLALVMFCSISCSAQETPQGLNSSPEQLKRIELLKSRGVDASLTILPVLLAGNPWDRVTEVWGTLFEQMGLKDIELGQTPLVPDAGVELERLCGMLSEFIGQHPVTTEYALYAEINGSRQTGIVGVRAVVLDKTGAVVWTEALTSDSAAFKNLEDRDPMSVSCLMVERLCPQFSLNEETAANAKPGKMARLMDERSGMPPEEERTPLPEREAALKEAAPKSTLMIFPARNNEAANSESMNALVKTINEAGLCKAIPATESILLKASQEDPSELKTLWGLAREFRDYVKKNPVDADYALYADYVFNSDNWEQGYVHFVICDRQGEWVVVDLQNSHQPDYKSIKPASIEGCNSLLVKRLEGYLR
jgi:hypothetical protein